MSILGADPEALDRLAAVVERSVVRIGQSERNISRQLTTAGWRGADADGVRLEWRTQGVGALGRMQAVLRECAAVLRLQAAAQREASAAGGGSGSDALFAEVDRNSTSRTYAAEAVLPLRFVNLKGGVAGTATVSRDERGYVLTLSGAARPAVTSGLPKSAKGASSGTPTAGGKAALGAELGTSAEVELMRSYRFDTLSEAEALQELYLKEVVPSMADVELETLFRGGVATDALWDGEDALARFEDQKESQVLKLSKTDFAEITFEQGLVDLNAGLHFGQRVEIDQMEKETSFFVSAGVDVGAALGVGGDARTAVEAGVTVDREGNPQTLTLSGSLELKGGLEGAFGVNGPSVQLAATSPGSPTAVEQGLMTTFDARLDLTDADNRRHAFAYLQATGAGEHLVAAGHLADLLDRTVVTVKTEATITAGHSIDTVVGNVSAETTRSTTKDVFIRMPQGAWEHRRMNP